MVRMGLRRSSSLFGVHYSTVRDYVFSLVDAAYWTLVIFVYIVYKIEKNALDGCSGIEKEGRFQRQKAMGRYRL
nr:DNA-directed RNA polymerase, subunit 2 [Tanacetum cinerariifolium]